MLHLPIFVLFSFLGWKWKARSFAAWMVLQCGEWSELEINHEIRHFVGIVISLSKAVLIFARGNG